MENRNPATLPEFGGRLSEQIMCGVGAALRGTCQMAGMRCAEAHGTDQL